jgi:hypothetical protein
MKSSIEPVRLRPAVQMALSLLGLCAIVAFLLYVYATARREDRAPIAPVNASHSVHMSRATMLDLPDTSIGSIGWATPGTYGYTSENSLTLAGSGVVAGASTIGIGVLDPSAYLDLRYTWSGDKDGIDAGSDVVTCYNASCSPPGTAKPQYFDGHAWVNADGTRP